MHLCAFQIALISLIMSVLAMGHALSSRLGSKTAYNMRRMLPNAPSLYSVGDPEGYKASYIWLLTRHGTRWPTMKKLHSINNLSSLFKRSELDKEHWVKKWTSPVAKKEDIAGRLHPIGAQEMQSLGERLRSRLPSLEARSEDLPPIIATAVRRTSESAEAFALGFLPNTPVSIVNAPKDQDPLLRPFDLGLGHNGYLRHEQDIKIQLKSWKSSYLSLLTSKIEDRLRLRRSTMDQSDVDALWQLLLFEGGLMNDFKTASLFDPTDLDMLEWLDDVDLYVRRGGGSTINYQIFQPLLLDLVRSLQAAVDRSEGPFMRLLFAHCETLVPFMTLLGSGLFKQGPQASLPQCSNSSDFSASVPFTEDRSWRSSAISPYGSNLAIIVYRRDEPSAPANSSLIRVLYNEQVITLSNKDSGSDLEEFGGLEWITFMDYLQSRVKSPQV